ncbi:S8 family peptidase [Tsuneonella mangrovi]|uniref:S8 family peptidase n=1 Tax=Tsuneonella mangrovi TaxID=1982042 RepID=UPI001470C5CE|nr:S8 family peptidase [Tsuneonella mangrovi]
MALFVVVLSGCGGSGGSVASTPPPTTTTPSTPTPTPSTTNFNTTEYQQSTGPAFHNAITAWQQGATGQGIKIGIVDTGIDTTTSEFTGRIDPKSVDVAGTRSIDDQDGHGTQVALVAAAARNNSGVMGIAFDATIVALRADQPGSCATFDPNNPDSGCLFDDTDIAKGVNHAVAAGATVINLSLGGADGITATMQQAIANAAAAGVVVVVAAGNGGDGSDPKIDPNNPDPFASQVRAAGGANVIIVGSVNDKGVISSFSNRAGSDAAYYLTALGEGVCCEYQNGTMLITHKADGDYVTVLSGTSFSAPQVAGAVALLKQAFPNLTGAEMVKILLDSATDAGVTGVDSTYGHGILDIAAAFAPQGTTTMAGSSTLVPLADSAAVASSAMGDSMTQITLDAVVLDGYRRAYNVNLGPTMRTAAVMPRLLGAVDAGTRQLGASGKNVSLAFTVAGGAQGTPGWSAPLRLTQEDAEQSRVLAAQVALKLAPTTTMGFAIRESANGLVAQVQGQERPAFLIARDANGDTGFSESADASFAFRQRLGRWGLTFSGQSGQAWLGTVREANGVLDRWRARYGTRNFALTADRRFGPVDTSLGATWLQEDRTVLGGYFANSLGGGGANTLFVDATAGWRFAEGWRLGGAFRQGWTRADHAGFITSGSNLTSRAWSLDVQRIGIFAHADRLGLRVSQPLRVESGGLALDLPISYDYATLGTTYGIRTLPLTPHGREMDGELAWSGPLWGGSASASLFYRKDPGHIASLPDDKGVALRWNTRF